MLGIGTILSIVGGISDMVSVYKFGSTLDRTLALWDVATGKELHTYTGHSGSVYSVAFSPNGRTALSGSKDETMKLWDPTPYLPRR